MVLIQGTEYPGRYSVVEKKMRKICRYIRRHCWDSNRSPSKYKFRKTQPHHPVR